MKKPDLEKHVKEQKEEIEKLKKKARRQKWMNLFLLFSHK
jgi:hypothetical protein